MLANPSAIKLREYERIFTGSNQDMGYENPILGYVSDTTLQILPVDNYTYFHFPITAPSGLLINSDLVNAGAVAGTSPYRSDKVWKKMANYFSTSIWGNSQPIGKQTGVWLCAWLSGNPYSQDSIPVWKDRWFNPGYIDAATSLFISNAPSAVIMDIDSELTFEAGCYYKYYHLGNIQNQIIVNTLSGTNSNLKIHLEDWKENPIDLSPYKNISNLENYNNNIEKYSVEATDNINDTCMVLDGINQDCRVLYNSSYVLTGDMTCSIWANSKNWSEVQGNQILSKNYRGGWNLKYNNGFFTPIIFVSDRNSGNFVFLNSDGKPLITKTLPSISHPIGAVMNSDLFTWVLDNGVYSGSKHLYKLDYNGDIVDAINLGTNESLKNIAIDQDENVWVLTTNSVSAFNNNLSLVSTNTALSSTNHIDFNINNNYETSQYSFAITTSGTVITAPTTSIVVASDRANNIWSLEGTNTFIKRDSTNTTVILSGSVGTSSALSGRNVNFTNEFNNGVYKDYAWFIQEADQSIFKYDMDGNLINRIDLSKYNINPYVLGDFTGYQRHKKFNYVKNNRMAQIQAELQLFVTPTSTTKLTMSVPVTAISNNDWHMFTFTYNQSSANFYMDAMLRDSKSMSYNNAIVYKYENPMILGANVGKLISMDEELDLTSLHFKGKIDDLRIYNIVLNISDIRHIYLNKFIYHDIKWNMPTGDQSYLEEVERFFKFKLPGLKSQYYNLKLKGLNITDAATKELIEDIIKNTIKKVTPAYAQLYTIIWE